MTAELPIRRKPTNLSLEADLVAEAGLRRAVAEKAKRRWQEENADGILQMNAYVEKHGLPLVKYCMF